MSIQPVNFTVQSDLIESPIDMTAYPSDTVERIGFVLSSMTNIPLEDQVITVNGTVLNLNSKIVEVIKSDDIVTVSVKQPQYDSTIPVHYGSEFTDIPYDENTTIGDIVNQVLRMVGIITTSADAWSNNTIVPQRTKVVDYLNNNNSLNRAVTIRWNSDKLIELNLIVRPSDEDVTINVDIDEDMYVYTLSKILSEAYGKNPTSRVITDANGGKINGMSPARTVLGPMRITWSDSVTVPITVLWNGNREPRQFKVQSLSALISTIRDMYKIDNSYNIILMGKTQSDGILTVLSSIGTNVSSIRAIVTPRNMNVAQVGVMILTHDYGRLTIAYPILFDRPMSEFVDDIKDTYGLADDLLLINKGQSVNLNQTGIQAGVTSNTMLQLVDRKSESGSRSITISVMRGNEVINVNRELDLNRSLIELGNELAQAYNGFNARLLLVDRRTGRTQVLDPNRTGADYNITDQDKINVEISVLPSGGRIASIIYHSPDNREVHSSFRIDLAQPLQSVIDYVKNTYGAGDDIQLIYNPERVSPYRLDPSKTGGYYDMNNNNNIVIRAIPVTITTDLIPVTVDGEIMLFDVDMKEPLTRLAELISSDRVILVYKTVILDQSKTGEYYRLNLVDGLQAVPVSSNRHDISVNVVSTDQSVLAINVDSNQPLAVLLYDLMERYRLMDVQLIDRDRNMILDLTRTGREQSVQNLNLGLIQSTDTTNLLRPYAVNVFIKSMTGEVKNISVDMHRPLWESIEQFKRVNGITDNLKIMSAGSELDQAKYAYEYPGILTNGYLIMVTILYPPTGTIVSVPMVTIGSQSVARANVNIDRPLSDIGGRLVNRGQELNLTKTGREVMIDMIGVIYQ